MKDDAMNRTKVLRGSALPHAQLDEHDVETIRALVTEREKLRRRAACLTNQALAEKFGVHVRTIERVLARETWSHV
jgi:predicted DNA-binding transcriptional regulator YafY